VPRHDTESESESNRWEVGKPESNALPIDRRRPGDVHARSRATGARTSCVGLQMFRDAASRVDAWRKLLIRWSAPNESA
jgi:hypothetical protein